MVKEEVGRWHLDGGGDSYEEMSLNFVPFCYDLSIEHFSPASCPSLSFCLVYEDQIPVIRLFITCPIAREAPTTHKQPLQFQKLCLSLLPSLFSSGL